MAKKNEPLKNNLNNNPKLKLLTHPLIQHKLSLMRQGNASVSKYYGLTKEIGMYMGFAMTEDLTLTETSQPNALQFVATKKPAVISMLRSGLVLAEGFRAVNPSIKIGHFGIYKEKGEVIMYLASIPDLESRLVIVLDMNITTGDTAIEAIERIKEHQEKTCRHPQSISFGCVTATTDGIANVSDAHGDVDLYVVSDKPSIEEGEFGYYSEKLYGLQEQGI